MKTFKFKWLIQGHLTQDQALGVCDMVKKSLVYEDLHEDDMLQFNLMIKLPDRSVFNYEKVNPTPEGQK